MYTIAYVPPFSVLSSLLLVIGILLLTSSFLVALTDYIRSERWARIEREFDGERRERKERELEERREYTVALLSAIYSPFPVD